MDENHMDQKDAPTSMDYMIAYKSLVLLEVRQPNLPPETCSLTPKVWTMLYNRERAYS